MRNPAKSLPVPCPWWVMLPKMVVCALEAFLMPVIQMKMSIVNRKHLL